MAKPRLTFTVAPTFKSKVAIPIPGAKPVDVEFTFKGRGKEEYKTFSEGLDGREDIDIVLDIASGWELDDPFGKESLEQLFETHMGAAREILMTYVREMNGTARLGNLR